MPVNNSGSGVTRYILENWRFLDASEFVFDFVTKSPRLDFSDRIAAAGGKAHHLSYSSIDDEECFLREMRHILDEDYDVVHLHTSYWNGFLVEKMARERGCPVVIVHSHSSMVDIVDPVKRERAIELHWKLKREFLPEYATHFCACSTLAADWLFGDQIKRGRIRILRNAIEVKRFAYNPGARERMRRVLGLENCLVLGHAGRFTYQKNHDLLLDIFARVYRKNPRARLVLAGDGPLREAIRERTARAGLDGKVIFLGKVETIAELLQAFDVYLQPSHFEGLSLTLVEAQAAGLKCLTSAGLAEETRLTPNLRFLPLDASVWVEAVLELDEGYERNDGSRLVAAAGYDLKDQIREIERLYRGELD